MCAGLPNVCSARGDKMRGPERGQLLFGEEIKSNPGKL